MLDVSPDFVKEHASLIAWVLGVCVASALALLGYSFRKCIELYNQAQHAFTNCLPTTQKNTEIIGNKQEETNRLLGLQNAKLDVLISVIEKKL
jgi:hypothetical protein